jgi:SOS-response transcriptional repressor LexA
MTEKEQMAVADALSSAMRNARREKRLTYHQVAEKIGVTYDKLNNIANRRTEPDLDLLEKVRKELGLPKGWPLSVGTPALSKVSVAGTPLAPIPVVGNVSAGPGSINVDVDASQVYVPQRLADIGGVAWVVDGESMTPLLEAGDVAIFREGSQPRKGYAFLLRTPDSELRVKTLEWMEGAWWMKSLNPTFDPEPLGGTQILGFLIGWYRVNGTRETLDSDPHGLRIDA